MSYGGKTRCRVLIGQFFHETHGFNPHSTCAHHIIVERGARLIHKACGTGTTLAGIVAELQARNIEIVPGLGFMAQPGGPLHHDFFEQLTEEFIAFAKDECCDAIALDLHGAMGTTRIADADGDFLARLRAAVGPAVPIGIGLDMHAHVTATMLEAVDVCIACKTSPHTDFPETGAKLIDLLLSVLDRSLRPVHAMAKAPMIHLDGGLTASGPLGEIVVEAAMLAAEQPAIRDISLFQVYRFADYLEQKGQTALVLTDAAPGIACDTATRLATRFWDNRERMRDHLLGIDAAFDCVAQNPQLRPYALADMGDRVAAGASGDSVAFLAHALRGKDGLKGVIPITDPAAVAAAAAAGVGATITLKVGGGLTPNFLPLKVSGIVIGLHDGRFRISGPALGSGEAASLGETASLLVDERLTLLLTTEPGLTHTPSAFTSQGIDLTAQDFIVVKSGMHFAANFEGIATPLVVATPGITFPAKGNFDWTNAHFWPETEIADPQIVPRLFVHNRVV